MRITEATASHCRSLHAVPTRAVPATAGGVRRRRGQIPDNAILPEQFFGRCQLIEYNVNIRRRDREQSLHSLLSELAKVN
jgi:hypothetical protein